MSYIKTNWQNKPNQSTPINAANLNHIEDGIYDVSTSIGDLNNLNTTEKSNIIGAINEVNSKTIPISQGGTGATTSSSAISNLGVSGTVLYSNESGTTGTITLIQPYTNFVRIGVYAQGQYDNDAIYNEIYTHINYMTLGATSIADTQYNCTVWRTAFINFSGTVISFINNCSSSYNSHQSNVDNRYAVLTGDGLKITRVVGYNY